MQEKASSRSVTKVSCFHKFCSRTSSCMLSCRLAGKIGGCERFTQCWRFCWQLFEDWWYLFGIFFWARKFEIWFRCKIFIKSLTCFILLKNGWNMANWKIWWNRVKCKSDAVYANTRDFHRFSRVFMILLYYVAKASHLPVSQSIALGALNVFFYFINTTSN